MWPPWVGERQATDKPDRTLSSPSARVPGGGYAPFRPRRGLHRRHPRLDVLLQQIERHGAMPQDLVVKGAEVEGGAQLSLRVSAQRLDLQLTRLVGQGQAGLGDIAVDLGFDGAVVLGR